MRSVNEVTLLGNLGKDAETQFTPSGVAKTTFTVATSRKWKQGEEWKEDTQWHNVVLWRSENVSAFLTKGKPVYVRGRIETRSYEAKDGSKRYVTEIVANDVILLGGKDAQSTTTKATKTAQTDAFADSDDCPF